MGLKGQVWNIPFLFKVCVEIGKEFPFDFLPVFFYTFHNENPTIKRMHFIRKRQFYSIRQDSCSKYQLMAHRTVMAFSQRTLKSSLSP